MKRFSYTAVDINKKKMKGQFVANDEEHLRSLLSTQDLFLVKCKEIKRSTPNQFFSLGGSVKLKDIAVFCNQFSSMFACGMEIDQILETLLYQPFPSLFKSIIQELLMDVRSGVFLSDAMKKHKKVFAEFMVSMVSVGEASGQLDSVFRKLTEYYNNKILIRSKIISACIYPVMLIVMGIGILALVMLYIMPQFRNVFLELNLELPRITVILFDISDFFNNYWKELLLGLGGVVLIIVALNFTKKGKLMFHTLIAHLPSIGKVVEAGFASRFARCFSTLIGSGMQIVDSLELISTMLGNKYYEKRFAPAIDDVKKGYTLTRAFNRTGIFPRMLLQMVSIGEKTGTLDETLSRSSGYFDQQQNDMINSATNLIQPILLVLIAGMLIVVMLGIFVPLMDIINQLGATT